MNKIVLVICLSVICLYAPAQDSTVNISGSLRFSPGEPASFLQVGLHRAVDSQLVKGTITDSSGKFFFDHLKKGNYLLSVTGSKSKYSFIYFAEAPSSVDIGTKILLNQPQLHEEARVRGRKPFLEHRIDRLVVNVDGSALMTGNSGLEVVSKLPGVQMLPGKTLTLNGSTDILVIIDGKSYRSSSEQGRQVLSALRSDNIEKVEIYTNPPARFDAQGTSVINILLKKDKMYSDVNLSYNSRLYPAKNYFGGDLYSLNTGVNLRYGTAKWRLTLSLSPTFGQNGYSVEQTESYFPGYATFRSSEMHSDNQRISASLGISRTLSPKDNISLYVNNYWVPKTHIETESGTTFKNPQLPDPDSIVNATVVTNIHYNNPEFILFYGHRFSTDGRKAMNISAVTGYYRSGFDVDYSIARKNQAPQLHMQNQDYDVDVKAIKADFIFPAKKYSFETGAKATLINNRDAYTINGAFANAFGFEENIVASYVNLRGSSKNQRINFQAGVRGEYTNSTASSVLIPGGQYERNYFNLFPSAFAGYTFKNKTTLNGSYSRRIARPNYNEFNPFGYGTFYDPYTTQKGNERLRPQYSNRYEISMLKKAFYTALNFTYSRNVRSLFAVQTAAGNVQLEPVNTRTANWSAIVSWNKELYKWWSASVNLNGLYYEAHLLNDEVRRSPSFVGSTNNSFKLSSKIKSELGINYFSPVKMDFWRLGGGYSINMAIMTSFLKEQLSATFAVEDLTGKGRRTWDNNYGQIMINTRPVSNERLWRISLSYRFITGNKFQARSRQSNDFGEIRYGK